MTAAVDRTRGGLPVHAGGTCEVCDATDVVVVDVGAGGACGELLLCASCVACDEGRHVNAEDPEGLARLDDAARYFDPLFPTPCTTCGRAAHWDEISNTFLHTDGGPSDHEATRVPVST